MKFQTEIRCGRNSFTVDADVNSITGNHIVRVEVASRSEPDENMRVDTTTVRMHLDDDERRLLIATLSAIPFAPTE